VASGPRLAVNVAHIYPNAGTEVRTMGPLGEAQARIAGGAVTGAPAPIYDTAPAWAPDGKKIAFFGPDGEGPVTYLAGEDGTRPRELKSMIAPAGPRSFVQEPPIFDPHGNLIASVFKLLRGHFERPATSFDEEGPPVVAVALWSFPTAGGNSHPLGPFKTGRILVPFSFAPDGTLLAEEATRAGLKIRTLDLQSGSIHSVIVDPQGLAEPAFSPDGSQIAYLPDRLGPRNGDEEPKIFASNLMVMPTAGGTPRLVAKVKGGARWPAWDPSGTRLTPTAVPGRSAAERGEYALGDPAMGRDVGVPVGADLDQARAHGQRGRKVGEGLEAAVGEVEEGGGALDRDHAGGAEEGLELVCLEG
jgi:WD40-like Beta Propeller Repeat